MDVIELGEKVRAARKEMKLTQANLANRAGISRERLNELENGKAGNIGFISVIVLLEELNLDLKITTFNHGRPTLDEIQEENEYAARLGR